MAARPLRLLLACLCAAGAAIALAAPPTTTRVERSGDAIVFTGRIDADSAQRFLALLDEPGVRRLVITSGGGLVAPALDMAEALQAHGLDLEVPRQCRSSCANYLFPAARHKTLGWPGAVAWHGTMAHVLHLAQTGKASWGEAQLAEARVLARREAALYERLGVDGLLGWFAKLPPYDVPDFYFLSPQDLERFGVRDVVVRDGAAPAGALDDLQAVQVDWPALQAHRPTGVP